MVRSLFCRPRPASLMRQVRSDQECAYSVTRYAVGSYVPYLGSAIVYGLLGIASWVYRTVAWTRRVTKCCQIYNVTPRYRW